MAHARVKHYKTTFSDGRQKLVPFSEAQAKEYGTVLETDGIDIDAAIRMVIKWNKDAKRIGSALRYSIPFINLERASERINS